MIRDHWSCETSMRECNTGDKHQGTGELIKTFWCPLIMHTHCRAPLLTTTCDSEQELRASHRGREATQHFSWSRNYSWLIYIFIHSGVFCPVIRSHQISGAGVSRLLSRGAMKLQELKIKFDVNTHATRSSIENIPQAGTWLARIKTSGFSRRQEFRSQVMLPL